MAAPNSTARPYFAMTLVEMLIAMALLLVVLAAIVPQIRAIQNSWASKRQNVEVIQNGRVLMDHIAFNLSQANRVTVVSDSTETSGYIEFEDNDGNTMRYEISPGNFVQFGPVGSLSELAGPVSELQFTCYDACDLDTPITDVNRIRSVKVDSTFTNSAELGRDQSFTGQAYLRTNAAAPDSGIPEDINELTSSRFEFDTFQGQEHDLCPINATHYLNVYSGPGDDGWSVILIVDTHNWTITKGTNFEFGPAGSRDPDVEPIDDDHYLVVYEGPSGDGWAVILIVDTVTDTITMGTPLEFDSDNGEWPNICRIDDDDFLCIYTGKAVGGQTRGSAVILTVDTAADTISAGTIFDFETTYNTEYTAVAQIDTGHYLAAYRGCLSGPGGCYGRAAVLTVNTVTKTVTSESFYNFYSDNVFDKDLCTIDENHFLIIFGGGGGSAMILTVDTGTWAIGSGAINNFFTTHPVEDIIIARQCTGSVFVGSFKSGDHRGIFSVDTETDTVNYLGCCPSDVRHLSPGLVNVDQTHFLETFDGPAMMNGWATILEIGNSELILP